MSARFNRNTLFLLGALLFVAASIKGGAQTQSPQVIITWKATSYAPPGYAGKVLPGPGSPMLASVQILDKGKIADLTGKTIRWYLDGSLIRTSTGNPHVTFAAPERAAPSSFELSMQIPGYQIDATRSELLFSTIIVPLAAREVVIEAPYPERRFRGASFAVTGVPYFFNVREPAALNFSWTVNGKAVTSTEDKELLEVRFTKAPAANTSVNVGLIVRDPSEDLNAGLKSITLISAP